MAQTAKSRTSRTKAKKRTAGRRSAQPAARRTAGKKAVRKTAARGGIKATNLKPADKRFLAQNQDKLSPTTLRAKWLNSPDEHEDAPGQSLATRSHEVIERWAEERGGVPATVSSTKKEGGRPGVLRLNFPKFGGRRLQEVSWEQWFRTFDKRKLVFLFQEHKKDGKQSNFFRFDSPLREEA